MENNKEIQKEKRMDFFIGSMIVLIFGGLLMQLLFEMRTFNKFNTDGPKATYMDALCSNLRILSK